MPYEPVNPVDSDKLTDRELLIILHERVGAVGRELHELKEGYAQRLSMVETKLNDLQTTKADRIIIDLALQKQGDNNELRTSQINKINNRLAFAAGGLAVLQVVLNIAVAFILKSGWPH